MVESGSHGEDIGPVFRDAVFSRRYRDGVKVTMLGIVDSLCKKQQSRRTESSGVSEWEGLRRGRSRLKGGISEKQYYVAMFYSS